MAKDAPDRPHDTSWSRLWGQFVCRSCGFRSPINFLDADGGLRCTHCGIEQAFDVTRWTAVLTKAHDVADPVGPRPPSQSPTWTEEKEHLGQLELEWGCAAGHPLCTRCGATLDALLDGEGNVVTRCSGCGDSAAYAPAGGAQGLYRPLVAVVADEHRADGQRAKVVRDRSDAVAIQCPVCNAPMTVTGQAPLETCSHCNASVRIPAEVRAASSEKEAVEPFWLLFQGASQTRRAAEEQARLEAAQRAEAADSIRRRDEEQRERAGEIASLLRQGVIWATVYGALMLGAIALPWVLSGAWLVATLGLVCLAAVPLILACRRGTRAIRLRANLSTGEVVANVWLPLVVATVVPPIALLPVGKLWRGTIKSPERWSGRVHEDLNIGRAGRGAALVYLLVGLLWTGTMASMILAVLALQPSPQREGTPKATPAAMGLTLTYGQSIEDTLTAGQRRDYTFSVDSQDTARLTMSSTFSVNVEYYLDGERLGGRHTDGAGTFSDDLPPGEYLVRITPYRRETEPAGEIAVTLGRGGAVESETLAW